MADHDRNGKRKSRRWLIPTIILALAVVVFFIGFALSDPPPPKKVRLATGSPGGAYTAYGELFAKKLEEWGLEVEIVHTKGSVENYQRLRSDDASEHVDLAFVQGGTRDVALELGADASVDLEELPVRAVAQLYSEPLWLFYRKDRFEAPIDRLPALAGAMINIGPHGSGTQPVARQILRANGIKDDSRLEWNSNEVAIDLLRNPQADLDALMMITSPHAPDIRTLLADEDLALMDFERHVAYSKAIPYLSQVELARGVVDLPADLPRESVSLLAPKAMLACDAELHPRVVELFYKAALDIFKSGNAVDSPNQFPNIDTSELAVAPAAEEFARNGEGWLSRNLPFWAVRLISQLKLALIPLLTVLLPGFKLVPLLLKFRVKSLLKTHYRALREAEESLKEAESPEELRAGLESVAGLRDEMARLSQKFPGNFQNDLYHWRLHLNLVRSEARERLLAMEESRARGESA